MRHNVELTSFATFAGVSGVTVAEIAMHVIDTSAAIETRTAQALVTFYSNNTAAIYTRNIRLHSDTPPPIRVLKGPRDTFQTSLRNTAASPNHIPYNIISVSRVPKTQENLLEVKARTLPDLNLD